VKQATANPWGDLVCPHCKVNIVAPKRYKVVEGTARCCWCHKKFTVPQSVAKESNLRRGYGLAALIERVIADGLREEEENPTV